MGKIWYTFKFKRGMSNRQVDKELRKIARQTKVDVPAGYVENLDKLLAGLPIDEPMPNLAPGRTAMERRSGKGRRHYRLLVPVTVLIVIITAVGIPIVGKAVSGLDDRMSEMSEDEITEYDKLVQEASTIEDTYTREYSEDESARMKELLRGYIGSTAYPDGTLSVINDISEWDGATPVYAVQTSTFCLPERPLSDEELLELMEFKFKRKHSVTATNEADAESEDRTVKRTEKEFIRLAAEAVEATLDIDVSEDECEIEFVENDMQYLITFTRVNQHVCIVMVDITTGGVMEVTNVSLRAFEDSEFEEIYIYEGYDKVLKCIDSDIWNKSEVKNVNVEYYLNNGSGKLHTGTIRYLVEMEDGSGYRCNYSGEQQMLGGIKYLNTCPSVEMWQSITDEAKEKLNLSREVLKLQ